MSKTMGKEKLKKQPKKVEDWRLGEKNRERHQARESLRWMYETARGAHAVYLQRFGVNGEDALNHDNHVQAEELTRKYMYDFIIMVMNLDHDFGLAMQPYVQAISGLFEDES